jgi:uncharacterized protein YjlB
MSRDPEVLTFLFGDAGAIPNNPALPLVVFKNAVERGSSADELARKFEELLPRGGWRAAWRWGVYDFPHYHSTAHEVLGCYRGSASLRLGHTKGVTLDIAPGDVVIIPAGVGHQNLGSSADFHVVGGYPAGQDADLMRADASASEQRAARERIARVPLPSGDPVFGARGPLS